jgi:hypothetical protein
MKLIVSVRADWTMEQVNALQSFGIFDAKTERRSSINLEPVIFEQLKEVLISVPHTRCVKRAVFDKLDIANARWLVLAGLSEFGYPQPEDTFDYLYDVYDMKNYCEGCGINKGEQKGSFHIKSDKIKAKMSQLYWTNDQVFVKKEIYESFFKPKNILSRPVIIHRSGKISEEIVQLDLTQCDWQSDFSYQNIEVCKICNTTKYNFMPQDFFPAFPREPEIEMFHSVEHFGSGAAAFKLIYLSQDICRFMIDEKIARWHQFYPVMS